MQVRLKMNQHSIERRHSLFRLVTGRRPAAFTLVELLVVISIIVLLISILLPALGSARVAAQRTRSLVNVKQISTALFIYANDSKDSMPFQQEYAINGSGVYFANRWSRQWSRILYESQYINSLDVYWSAAKHRYDGDFPYSKLDTERHMFESTGYGLNRAVSPAHESDFINNKLGLYNSSTDGDFTLGQQHLAPLRLGDVTAPPPSNMMLLMETATSGNSFGGLNGFFLAIPGRQDSQGEYKPFHYGGAIVHSYVDGHAVATAGSNAIRVTGRQNTLNNNPTWAPTVVNELGYNTAAAAGPLDGLWSIDRAIDTNEHEPWFVQWRTGWTKGLRP